MIHNAQFHISDLLDEVKKRSSDLRSKYEYCKTLTLLSESLKKQIHHSSEDAPLKTSVLEHFKVTQPDYRPNAKGVLSD